MIATEHDSTGSAPKFKLPTPAEIIESDRQFLTAELQASLRRIEEASDIASQMRTEEESWRVAELQKLASKEIAAAVTQLRKVTTRLAAGTILNLPEKVRKTQSKSAVSA